MLFEWASSEQEQKCFTIQCFLFALKNQFFQYISLPTYSNEKNLLDVYQEISEKSATENVAKRPSIFLCIKFLPQCSSILLWVSHIKKKTFPGERST